MPVITFDILIEVLKDFAIFIYDVLMLLLLLTALAILVAGSMFVFRTAFMIWYEDLDPYNFVVKMCKSIKEAIVYIKNKVKGLFVKCKED